MMKLDCAALMLLPDPAARLLSEWLNTTLWRWMYSALMPMLNVAGIEIGVSPLLQWFFIPPLALYLARRRTRRPRLQGSRASTDAG
jgi:hypothetical protein